MTTPIASQKLAKALGRHTRLAIPFQWKVAGVLVDLEAGGYTARAWVTAVDGTTVDGPKAMTVAGTTATYMLDATDLATASPTGLVGNVKVVAVAENTTTTLPSDAREIPVGDWGGADTYLPGP